MLERIDKLNILYCPEGCGGDTEKYAEFPVKVKDTLKRIQLLFRRQSCRRSRQQTHRSIKRFMGLKTQFVKHESSTF